MRSLGFLVLWLSVTPQYYMQAADNEPGKNDLVLLARQAEMERG
jgi:hypothetical protein